MKNGIIIISILITFILNSFQTFCNEQKVISSITDVTVFLKGAQINRTATIEISKGVSHLVFTGLSTEINQQSIQVSAKGNFTILSVNHQVNYLSAAKKSKQTLILEDSLEIIQNRINIKKYEVEVYTQEQDMLNMNKSVAGDNGLKVTDLQAAVNFFRKRMMELKKKELNLNKELKELNRTLHRLKKQLGIESKKKNAPSGEIVVKVSADNATQGTLYVKYLVRSAGWIPNYDVKVMDIDQPIDLIYKANVYQHSGEDWENINLTISTGNPSESGTKPILRPWYLRFHEVISYQSGRYNVYKLRKEESLSMIREEAVSEYKISSSIADFTEVSQSQTNTEFNIQIPFSVPSDGKKYLVEIQKHKLDADFEYFAVPKIDKDAFLVAHITGWEDYNLLSGELNLFFEGTYVGKSVLDVRNTGDTLDFSLGRDKSIVITRIRMKEFTDKKFLGGTKKETRAWQISIRNTKNKNIKIVIEDQVPVSTHEDIEIETLETSKAKYNTEKGNLKWYLELKPGESKNLIVKYLVKYPKDKKLILD